MRHNPYHLGGVRPDKTQRNFERIYNLQQKVEQLTNDVEELKREIKRLKDENISLAAELTKMKSLTLPRT